VLRCAPPGIFIVDTHRRRHHACTRAELLAEVAAYNGKVGLALLCPITSQSKGYPFEVAISTRKLTGVVLSDQVKSLDWRARQAEMIEHVPDTVVQEVLAKLSALLA